MLHAPNAIVCATTNMYRNEGTGHASWHLNDQDDGSQNDDFRKDLEALPTSVLDQEFGLVRVMLVTRDAGKHAPSPNPAAGWRFYYLTLVEQTKSPLLIVEYPLCCDNIRT